MPYSKKDPPSFAKNMPAGAQKIAIETANAVLKEGGKEEDAIRAAIANVKKEYKKVGDKWVPKAALVDVELIITKASLHDDGTMRWAATASDTGRDRTGEATSLPLFQDWIDRVEVGKSVSFLPPPRVPFLGLSHYPSLEGQGEAGPTEKMYIDGNAFKAAGVFYGDEGHPVGKALFEAVRSELQLIRKGQSIDRPIRISAAWWDLAHSHGDFIFERKSLNEICPMCAKGAGGKTYLKGQLDHFAATRVPINPRTSLELEEKSMAKITRKDDAASIVGDELAEELDELARPIGKSEAEEEALVVKADEVEKAAMKTVGGKKYPASDFLVAEDPKSPSTWHLQVKRNGKPDHGLMGGAWAALHEGHRGNKYDGPGKSEAINKLKKLYASEKMDLPSKADVEMMDDEGYMMPFNGAMSLGDAEEYIAAQEKMSQLYTNWGLFATIMGNILDHAEPGEMQAKVKALIGEFGSRVDAIKSAVEDAVLIEYSGGNVMSEQQTEQSSADVLKAAVDTALANEGLDRKAKFEAIQKALESYAEAVKAEVDAVAPEDPGEAVQKALMPVLEKLDLIAEKMGQAQVPAAMPQQKSYAPTGLVQPEQQQKPPTIRDIVRRSVGIPQ